MVLELFLALAILPCIDLAKLGTRVFKAKYGWRRLRTAAALPQRGNRPPKKAGF